MSQGKPEAALRTIALPLRLTLLGLWAERLTRAFWPLWTLLIAGLALLSFSVLDHLPLEAGWFAILSTLAGLIWAAVHGWRAFARPTRAEALARLDATLPGRPIAALQDTQAIGSQDPASQAVWQAHRARMAARAAEAKAVEPDLKLANRDVFGLRYMALTLLVLGLLFGSIWRVASLGDLAPGAQAAAAQGPAWEGWIEPPPYTGKPTLYLADQADEALTLPVGSKIMLRFYGEAGSLILAETVSGRTDVPPASEPVQTFTLAQSGRLAIQGEGGREWLLTALPDAPPAIRPEGEMKRLADGRFRQGFAATDDYGVTRGQAVLALDLPQVDRRHGLALDPEPSDPVTLDLALPMKRDRREVTGVLADDLSKDRLANLPVILTFRASDAAGQEAAAQPLATTLPGRRFFDPLAASLIEMRRDLLWNRQNAPRVSQVLKAISHKPEGLFRDDKAYLRLRSLISRLDSAGALDDTARDEIAEELWAIALMVEEGDLASALDRLRRAQDRIEEAIRNGATPEEIDQLMQEMQDALNDYMRQEAERNGSNEQGADTPQSSQNGQGLQMSQDQLNQMLQKLEELMKQGRTAEAQELMDQLRQMMENMRVTKGEGQGTGPGSPGEQAMRDLGETLRDQQDLSDDAFRDLQQGPGSPQDGEGQGLADRQRDLQDRLDQLQDQGDLPGAGRPEGQEGRRQLDRAGRAMEDAERALREGDLPGALDRQAEALDALRNGMRSLNDAQTQERQAQNGQQGQPQLDGNPDGQRDPLGRETGQSNRMGSDQSMLQQEDVYRRAQDLLDEIRRRAGEQARPDQERSYLKRLLDLF